MTVNYCIESTEDQPKCLIKNVKKEILSDGQRARVTFGMDYHLDYHYCLVFDVSEEAYRDGVDLAWLLRNAGNIDIIDRKTRHDHIVSLSDAGTRCMFFAARRDGATYYIQDQQENNVSDCLRIVPTITCNVRYEKLLTGGLIKRASHQYQKAIFRISGKKRPVDGTYIIYSCTQGGRDGRCFGIDVRAFWGSEMEIVIRKDEVIEFLNSDNESYLLKII